MWPVLPPPPEGALGWNVYTGGGTFIGFAPDEAAITRAARQLASDVEAFTAGED